MDPTTDLAAARLSRFLEEEPVLWLSTVGEDGAPHLVPTWFAWDGESVVIVSKPGARKVRDVAANPRVMVALGDAEDDFDVGMLEADAELLSAPTPADLPRGFAAKYGDRIAGLGLTLAQFARIYPSQIRLTPVRALGWHGRTTPASVFEASTTVARHRRVSIAEPWRATLRELFGEPIGRLTPI
jgi:PPOX class probable F420-dependent enzyme